MVRQDVAGALVLLLAGGVSFARAADEGLPPGAVRRLSAPGPVVALAFAPDGSSLAAVAEGRRDVRLWDTKTGRPLHTLAHVGSVGGLAWSSDGRALACACSDGAVYVWDGATGRARRRLRGHAGRVAAVAFAPDGKALASGGADGTVRLWDAATGEQRRCIKGSGEVVSLDFAPDGKRLAVTGAGGAGVRLLDSATGAEERVLKRPEKVGRLRAVFGPGGRLLASWGVGEGYQREVVLWGAALGEQRQQLQVLGFDRYPSRPCQARFSVDGRALAVGGPDRATRLWEVATGQELLRLRGHGRDVHAVAFSPDGRHLATGGEEATVLVWALDRCAVTTPNEKVDAEAVARWWADLAGEDAARAYRAEWLLAAAPVPAVALARRHLRPVPPLPAGRLQRLLADLDHDQYAAREAAEAELKALGRRAEADLRRTLASTQSAEVRRRVRHLLRPLDGNAGALPQERLASRALAVLERAGSDEARRLVKELADGCPTANQTQEARAVLARWGRSKRVAEVGGRP
jgi:dipeptidyl aminopeptidase/acylaminoacyl peptidase